MYCDLVSDNMEKQKMQNKTCPRFEEARLDVSNADDDFVTSAWDVIVGHIDVAQVVEPHARRGCCMTTWHAGARRETRGHHR